MKTSTMIHLVDSHTDITATHSKYDGSIVLKFDFDTHIFLSPEQARTISEKLLQAIQELEHTNK